MSKMLLIALLGLALMVLARFLWKKGNPEEKLWMAILGSIIDIITFQFASSIRTLAVLLYLIGFLIIVFSLLRIVTA